MCFLNGRNGLKKKSRNLVLVSYIKQLFRTINMALDLIKGYKFTENKGDFDFALEIILNLFDNWNEENVLWYSQEASFPGSLNYKNPFKKKLYDIIREDKYYCKLVEHDYDYKIKQNGRLASIYVVNWQECEFFSLILQPNKENPDFSNNIQKIYSGLELYPSIPEVSVRYHERMKESMYLQWGREIGRRNFEVFLKT